MGRVAGGWAAAAGWAAASPGAARAVTWGRARKAARHTTRMATATVASVLIRPVAGVFGTLHSFRDDEQRVSVARAASSYPPRMMLTMAGPLARRLRGNSPA